MSIQFNLVMEQMNAKYTLNHSAVQISLGLIKFIACRTLLCFLLQVP